MPGGWVVVVAAEKSSEQGRRCAAVPGVDDVPKSSAERSSRAFIGLLGSVTAPSRMTAGGDDTTGIVTYTYCNVINS